MFSWTSTLGSSAHNEAGVNSAPAAVASSARRVIRLMAIFLPGSAGNLPLNKTIRCGFTHGANWASGPGLANVPGKSRNCKGLGQTIVRAAGRWESRNNRQTRRAGGAGLALAHSSGYED